MTEIHHLLDKEKQIQARRYEREKRLLGIASAVLSLVVLLAFYFSGFSGWLARLNLGHSIVWIFLVYVASFQSLLALFNFPFYFYSSYVHEHKWKFSNQTLSSWLWDQIKAFLVGLMLLFLILGLLFWIMDIFPRIWWLIAGLAMALVSVVLATLVPVVILPLFNKYTPIQNEELTQALDKILSQAGLRNSGFFREDTSRQTKKENAFLAGLGKTRRVVLADNLMEQMTVPEMESIMAHEVGHYRHRQIWKNILIGTAQQLVTFYILNLVMVLIFSLFLTSTEQNLTCFPIFVVLMGAISGILFGPLSRFLSRYFERQADRYALAAIKNKKPFMTALAGLANRNLSNAYPQWWVKLLYYSHPPIGERLQMAEEFDYRDF